MESKLSDLPVKVLAEISKKALENGFDFENPYDFGYEESAEILEESSAWTGVGPMEALDIEFIAKFISLNYEPLTSWIDGEKNFNELGDLFLPKSKRYMVNYSSKGRGYITQTYSTDWNSYDQGWVEDSMSALSSAGDWSYYDGDYNGSEVDDFEEDELEIDSVEDYNIKNESILDRLVVENTSDILNSLDRKTLLELKKLIDSKLRLF